MPSDKDFKRLVRGRMQKTGESYTAARATLLKKPPRKAPVSPPAVPDYAKLAGMSDAAVEAKTGCNWAKWVWALDYLKAYTWTHREIAEYVHEKYQVPDWWSQTVTVGYERIRGLRDIGQRRGGSYEASRSKTVAVPVARLYRAFADGRVRNRWLPGVTLKVRKATPNKSVRITWADDTSVEVWFIAKGDAKASAAVSHRGLTGKEDVARVKAYWGERLDALADVLTGVN
ncbi:MAG TPA: hypothetical protein VGA78_02205 [Gemmatimonadales bacterium]|jgi:hypothetical protein